MKVWVAFGPGHPTVYAGPAVVPEEVTVALCDVQGLAGKVLVDAGLLEQVCEQLDMGRPHPSRLAVRLRSILAEVAP